MLEWEGGGVENYYEEIQDGGANDQSVAPSYWELEYISSATSAVFLPYYLYSADCIYYA